MPSDERISQPPVSGVQRSRRPLAVRWGALLTICIECFVKHDVALRDSSVKGENEENFRGNALEDKFFDIPESELFVILRMPNETTTSCIEVFQARQAASYQRLANALFLKVRVH